MGGGGGSGTTRVGQRSTALTPPCPPPPTAAPSGRTTQTLAPPLRPGLAQHCLQGPTRRCLAPCPCAGPPAPPRPRCERTTRTRTSCLRCRTETCAREGRGVVRGRGYESLSVMGDGGWVAPAGTFPGRQLARTGKRGATRSGGSSVPTPRDHKGACESVTTRGRRAHETQPHRATTSGHELCWQEAWPGIPRPKPAPSIHEHPRSFPSPHDDTGAGAQQEVQTVVSGGGQHGVVGACTKVKHCEPHRKVPCVAGPTAASNRSARVLREAHPGHLQASAKGDEVCVCGGVCVWVQG
jgi:hypothetical protein